MTSVPATYALRSGSYVIPSDSEESKMPTLNSSPGFEIPPYNSE